MSSMADLAGALGGGAAGPGPGGPPPDLASALGGAPPSDSATDTGAPDTGADQTQQFPDSLAALDAADDALHAFIQIDPDDADRAQATQALQIVLKLKASNQQDASQGGMKSLQRALAGSAGAPPGGAGPGGAGPGGGGGAGPGA